MLNTRLSLYVTPLIRHGLGSSGGSVPYSHRQSSKVTTWWRALLFPPIPSNLGGSNRASRGQKAKPQRQAPVFPLVCLVTVSPSPPNNNYLLSRFGTLHFCTSALCTLHFALCTSARRPCLRCPFHANQLKWKRSSAPHHSGSRAYHGL